MVTPESGSSSGRAGAVVSRKPSALSLPCSASIASTSAAASGSRTDTPASQAWRSPGGSSRASSRYVLARCQRLRSIVVIGPFIREIGNGRRKTTSERRGLLAHGAMEVNTGLFPVPLRGTLRNPKHGGDFGEAEAAEKLQVNDTGEAAVDSLELVQGVAEAAQLSRVGGRTGNVRPDRRDLELPAALLRLTAARIIDDEPPHHARGVAHEARTIGKRRPLAIRNVEVGLVEQRRGTERYAGPAPRELTARHPVELGVQ